MTNPPLPPNPQTPPPGLYPDPEGSGFLRQWTGTEWANLTQEPVVRAAAPTPQGTQPYMGSYAPPPPAKKSHVLRNVLIVLAVLAVLVGGCTAIVVAGTGKAINDSVNEQKERDAEAFNEVKIEACEVDETLGVVSARGTVKNGSADPSTYVIEVRYVGPDGVQIGTGPASVSQVQHDATAQWAAIPTPVADGVRPTCELADVTRFAS